jgi:hypothetical protein
VAVTLSARRFFDLAQEARGIARGLQGGMPGDQGRPVAVSGVLAEQLVRELDAGARSGAVQLGGDVPTATSDVEVRVIAGEPSDPDVAFVRAADRRGVPVVLVQLWPQADWTRPFVLSPFVVECEAGKGFPVREIADRIVEAAEHAPLLASGIPALRPSIERKIVRSSIVYIATLAALERRRAARPLIVSEQVRMLARLSATGERGSGTFEEPAALGAATGALLASGFALREVARTTRFLLPAPVSNALVAAAGTWMLAAAARAFGSRAAS